MDTEYTNITMAELKDLISSNPDLVIMDVRTANEIKEGKIKDAVENDVYDQNNFLSIAQKYKSKPIAVYCRSGGRSKMAASTLVQNGFNNVYNCTEGFLSY